MEVEPGSLCRQLKAIEALEGALWWFSSSSPCAPAVTLLFPSLCAGFMNIILMMKIISWLDKKVCKSDISSGALGKLKQMKAGETLLGLSSLLVFSLVWQSCQLGFSMDLFLQTSWLPAECCRALASCDYSTSFQQQGSFIS